MQIRLLQRFRVHGGAAYLAGEQITVPDPEGQEYVARGWAEPVGAADPGAVAAGAPVPVSEAPPVDKAVKAQPWVKKK